MKLTPEQKEKLNPKPIIAYVKDGYLIIQSKL